MYCPGTDGNSVRVVAAGNLVGTVGNSVYTGIDGISVTGMSNVGTMYRLGIALTDRFGANVYVGRPSGKEAIIDGNSIDGIAISVGSYDGNAGIDKEGILSVIATDGNSVEIYLVIAGTVGNLVNVYVGKAVGTLLNVGYGLMDGSGGTE